MIEGIDIFQPRPSGLPDFSAISPGQIFNGSVAASLAAMRERDPYGYGQQEIISPERQQPVEVRRARVVEEILSTPVHKRLNGQKVQRSTTSSGGESLPGYGGGEPPLPDKPETPADNSLVPPMPDYIPMAPVDGTPSLFPPELTPQEQKSASLRELPVILLEQLKSLHLV